MKLEEFNQMVTEASQKAHLFIADSIGGAERVRSVALRIDDDGVLSIILHSKRMKSRIPTDEAAQIEKSLKAMRDVVDREPALKDSFEDFDGFFVHWDEVADAMKAAGPEYEGYSESPLELITQLIDERDDLLEQVNQAESEIENLKS